MQYLSENQPLLSLVPSMALTQIIQIWLSPPLTAMPLQLACCLAPRNVVQPPPPGQRPQELGTQGPPTASLTLSWDCRPGCSPAEPGLVPPRTQRQAGESHYPAWLPLTPRAGFLGKARNPHGLTNSQRHAVRTLLKPAAAVWGAEPSRSAEHLKPRCASVAWL